MRSALILAALASLAAAPCLAKTEAHDDWSPPVGLTLDQPRTIGDAEVACTGIGQTRADPQWARFPVRLEVANRAAEYLVGSVVSVADARGRHLFTVSCDAPWLLLRLPAGSYRVQARLTGAPNAAPRSATITPPRTGQSRIVLTFPDA
jgi:hypothetical protein